MSTAPRFGQALKNRIEKMKDWISSRNRQTSGPIPMAFNIFRRLEDGEMSFVGTFDDLEKAQEFMRNLNDHWPGYYEIRRIA